MNLKNWQIYKLNYLSNSLLTKMDFMALIYVYVHARINMNRSNFYKALGKS